jgi:multiple sugar transport system ATP-binding protein
MARVVFEGVTKVFAGRSGEVITALRGINLTLADKEMLVLVGPSGSGKTTLLRLISGLEEPTSGTIRMDKQVLNRIAPAQRDVAMVFQQPALYPHMSVFQNMAFGLKLRKCSRTEIQERVTEAADMLGLTECLERKPMALSGGERQRVALGRAIVRRPKLFLYDEPLSNLDPHLRNRMRLEISKIHERLGATTIYVTHDQGEAMTLGRRIAVLDQGLVCQVDEPLNLYDKPADLLVAGFFGAPAMNFFHGTIKQKGEGLEFVMEHGAAEALNEIASLCVGDEAGSDLRRFVDRKVMLGIRPEHICPKLRPPASAPAEQGIVALVNRVDCLGAETQLHLALGGHEFVARIIGQEKIETHNNTLEVEFKMHRAHFFDPSAGKRIGSRGSMETQLASSLTEACAS